MASSTDSARRTSLRRNNNKQHEKQSHISPIVLRPRELHRRSGARVPQRLCSGEEIAMTVLDIDAAQPMSTTTDALSTADDAN